MSGRNRPPDPPSSPVKRSSRTPMRNQKYADFVQSLPSGSRSGVSSPPSKLKSEEIDNDDDDSHLGICKEQSSTGDGSIIVSENPENQNLDVNQRPNTESEESNRFSYTRQCDVNLMNISSQRRLGLAVKMLLNRLDYDDG